MLKPEQSMLRTAKTTPPDCRPESGVQPDDLAGGFVAATLHIERNIP
jgi:hypothetical protein